MAEPLVCCIMLTRDRPAMARRAVECFRAQTYERASMICLDTGAGDNVSVQHYHMPMWADRSIGALRNEANAMVGSADIIAHWDDDDWSHPHRLAEQVALLQASGADVVGYRDMLFWDQRPGAFCGAWLYSNPLTRGYALGTSLMYWRKTWKRCPFDDSRRRARMIASVAEWAWTR